MRNLKNYFHSLRNRINRKIGNSKTESKGIHADEAATRRVPVLRQQRDRYAYGEAEPLYIERTKPRNFVLSVLFCMLGILFSFCLILAAAGCGVVLGIARVYIETSPALDTGELENTAKTSYIYDMNGEQVTTFAGTEFREYVSIKEIPDMLKNAFIAVEDVRFYKHGGLDYKRLISAVINAFRNEDTHGGSTITQQLIKNRLLSTEQTYKRKIQEAYLSIQLESEYDKDQILEAYLNDIHLGESNYGVKAAAADYFGKDLKDLTIRECAMLAGLTQNPYQYNPRKNMYQRKNFKVTDERTNTVLKRMHDAGFITKEQYDAALAGTVSIVETSQQKQMYDMPYFVEYSIYDVVTQFIKSRNLQDTKQNRTQIENEIRTGGYHIYTTVDPTIQHTVEDTLVNWKNYPKMRDPKYDVKIERLADGSTLEIQQPQAAAVIIDYKTGAIRAMVGGRHQPTAKKQLNRAYTGKMPVGSSIKPLTVYGPALDAGASPASIEYNFPVAIDGYGGSKGYPGGNNEKYYGTVTLREGLRMSLNIVAARTLFDWSTPQLAADYLTKMGIDASRVNMDGPGLVLGTSGITPLEMASAYGAIANGGEWIQPLSFTKVTDSNGNILLDAETIKQKNQIYKKTTAWLLIDMMTDAVNSGTGTKAKISGITVAGKTGTNDDYRSVYFAGMTPNYAASVWIGHDDYSPQLKSGTTGGDYAAPLWQAFMSKISKGQSNKSIMPETASELGLVKRTVCRVSGLLATDACKLDAMGLTPVTDWFEPESVPTETCNLHATVNICPVSGKLATPYCPASVQKSILLVPTDSTLSKIGIEIVKKYMTHAQFSNLTAAQISQLSPGTIEYTQYYCGLHNAYTQSVLESLVAEATNDYNYVAAYMTNYGTQLTPTQAAQLTSAQSVLYQQLHQQPVNQANLQTALINLKNTFKVVTGSDIP